MHGVPLEGTEKKRWLLMIDPQELQDMPKGLSPQAKARWLSSRIRTPQQVDELHLDRFMGRLNTATGGSAGLVFAMLGVLANWVALDSVRDGERKALAHSKSEGLLRVYAQGAQLIGAVAATVDMAMGKLPALTFALARGMQNVSARISQVLAKGLGVGGSLFMAGIDGYRAIQEARENNIQGALAFGVSAALGATATALLYLSFTGWGLFVVGLMILWAFVMTALVDNSVQDWMERCKWGVLTEQRYGELGKEMSEFRAATQG